MMIFSNALFIDQSFMLCKPLKAEVSVISANASDITCTVECLTLEVFAI